MIPQPWKQYFLQSHEQRTHDRLVRKLRHLRHMSATRVQIGSRSFVNFAGNDYLGLAGDLRIAEAAATAAGRFGWGTGASRLVTGSSVLHQKLEQEVAAFRGTEAALLFGSGYQANLGVISALAGKGDVVVSDEMNHASIVAGCRLSGAHVRVFKHRDYDDLERQLGQGGKGRRLVITDSLFSVEGDAADLPRMVKVCDRLGALLVVDDAHANAALGRKGRGLPEVQNVLQHVAIVVGTFSKALGSYGGFVACSNEIREHLINESRPFIYTTSMPIALAAANLEALRIVHKGGEPLRQKLAAHARTLRARLQAQGIPMTGAHHIIGISVGEADRATFLADEIEAQGMLAWPMRWPTVPKGRETLRISVSAAHTEEEITRMAQVVRAAWDHMGGKRTAAVSRREARRPSHQSLEVAADSDMDESAFGDEGTSLHDAPAGGHDAPDLERSPSRRLAEVEATESGGFESLLNEELAYQSPEAVKVTLLEEDAQAPAPVGATLVSPEPASPESASPQTASPEPTTPEPVSPEPAPPEPASPEPVGATLASPAAAANDEPVPDDPSADDARDETDSGEIAASPKPAAEVLSEVPSESETALGREAGSVLVGDPVIAEIAEVSKQTRRQRPRRTTRRTTRAHKKP